MQHVQKQYGVTNNLTELEIPWTRGKRSADGTMCVMIQPDERTTGTIILYVLIDPQMHSISSKFVCSLNVLFAIICLLF